MNYKQKAPLENYIYSSDTNTESLKHVGVKRRSGRYAWGSGENPFQHEAWFSFYQRYRELETDGFKPTAENLIKEFGEGMTPTKYRQEKTYANTMYKMNLIKEANRLHVKGCEANGWKPMGATEIGKYMGGVTESTVRGWLDADEKVERMSQAAKTADFLKEQADKKGMVDVGSGVESELNITKTKLDDALFLLEKQGYHVYKGGIPYATNQKQQVTQAVLTTPDKSHKDIYDYENVHSLTDYVSKDGGTTYTTKEPVKRPVSLDSKRLQICYKEDGGIDKDGMIEIRRGVKDLALTDSTGDNKSATYAQVRIMVDGTHYLKGMAVYSDDLPKGVDVRFNTNKSKSVAKMDVLKKCKDNPNDPFGSLIKEQNYYTDSKGNKTQGCINYRAVEGDWDEWQNAVPSQMLSKQSNKLAKQQLNIKKEQVLAEYDSIKSINNPVIRKYYLNKFAEECDSNAVNLKAASFPRQHYQVILSTPTIKENEVYAPNYKQGEKLALIRYPHGGTFEIPIVTVNNKQNEAKKMLGNTPVDAVCVHPKVAARLSGADFDGDTVMCIPQSKSVKITSSRELEGLKGYDPKDSYGGTCKKEKNKDGTETEHWYNKYGLEYKIMSEQYKQKQMGVVSNLITDMTILGSTPEEKARAVRHSMTVIDATKHHLDYKQSEVDNDVDSLKKKYQSGGASTIISRAKNEETVLKRQGSPTINIKGKSSYDPTQPEGALIYKTSEDLYYPRHEVDKSKHTSTYWTTDGKKITYDYTDKEAVAKYAPVRSETTSRGKSVYGSRITNADGTIEYQTKIRTQKSTKMAEAKDARSLMSSPTSPKAMEVIYADYANYMKQLANQARKEYAYTANPKVSKTAKETYAKEVDSLLEKVRVSKTNRPMTREAERRANVSVKKQIDYAKSIGEPLDKEHEKKARQKAITAAREEVGSKSRRERYINITDKEWEAIQSGAISANTLNTILNATDPDELRERATPKESNTITQSQIARIKAFANADYTNAEIAKKLGISTSTVAKYLKGV